jgi:hypothetical protein
MMDNNVNLFGFGQFRLGGNEGSQTGIAPLKHNRSTFLKDAHIIQVFVLLHE